jgi:hypothetical protein
MSPFVKTSLMQPRRIKLVLTVLAVGVVAVALTLREPAYQGRGVRGWLQEFDTHANDAAVAFRQIGPAALPVLKHELQVQDRAWQTNLIGLSRSWLGLKLPFTPAHLRRHRAVRACAALGPAARPAIPALGVALGLGSSEALGVLKQFGPDAVTALAHALTNASGCGTPYGTAQALGALGAPARGAVTNLIWEYEHCPIGFPCVASAVAAGDICFDLIEHAHEPGAAEVTLVKAALIRGLHGTNEIRLRGAALGLGRFRTHAQEVAPTLRALGRHPGKFVRESAAQALAEVTSEAAAAEAGVRD